MTIIQNATDPSLCDRLAALATATVHWFLCFRDGQLVMEIGDDLTVAVKTEEDFEHLISFSGGCNCSSSVDFPEDETDDASIISLCRIIRQYR